MVLSSQVVQVVFSTSVEVFPALTASTTTSWGLLHVRGGVSEGSESYKAFWQSSPRPWRCFFTSNRLVT